MTSTAIGARDWSMLEEKGGGAPRDDDGNGVRVIGSDRKEVGCSRSVHVGFRLSSRPPGAPDESAVGRGIPDREALARYRSYRSWPNVEKRLGEEQLLRGRARRITSRERK